MKINTKLLIPYDSLINELKTESNYDESYYGNENKYINDHIFDSNDISVMLLILLYHNNIITKKQYCVYINKYDTLSRRINTYHSNITNKWYNNCNFTYILLDTVIIKYDISYINLKEFIKYINIGFSKKYSWCINYFKENIINKILDYYNKDLAYDILKDFKFNIRYETFEKYFDNNELSSSYCCEDCDGDFIEYMRHRYDEIYNHLEIKCQIIKELELK
jgi:hypothetical protein